MKKYSQNQKRYNVIAQWLALPPHCSRVPSLILNSVYCILNDRIGFIWVFLLPSIFQNMTVGGLLSTGVDESVNVFVPGISCIGSRLYSCLMPSIPGIGSRTTATLARMKMNEWTNQLFMKKKKKQWLVDPTFLWWMMARMHSSSSFVIKNIKQNLSFTSFFTFVLAIYLSFLFSFMSEKLQCATPEIQLHYQWKVCISSL